MALDLYARITGPTHSSVQQILGDWINERMMNKWRNGETTVCCVAAEYSRSHQDETWILFLTYIFSSNAFLWVSVFWSLKQRVVVLELFLASKILRVFLFSANSSSHMKRCFSAIPEQFLPLSSRCTVRVLPVLPSLFDYRVNIPVITNKPTVDQSAWADYFYY